jgi:superfamily II DNA or RNA helicase
MPAPVPTTPRANARSDLRAWQKRALVAMDTWTSGSLLISAAPGAGKTRPSLEFVRRQLAAKAIDAVVVACPTAPLTRQWARAAHELGVNLAPDANSPRPPSGFHGVSVTYARIAKAPKRWANTIPRRTLVIADEAHHLGEDLTWGESFQRAFAQAPRWLLLSGTPFRSDATPIPGVSYDADGNSIPDVSYAYAEAMLDGVCRPVAFVAYDGTLSWRSGDDVIESSFETVLSKREASRRYRTAISTDLPDGLPRILKEADVKLREIRANGHRDAAGLVIAADSDHARRIAKLLREETGRVPVVVLHAEARAATKLAEFKTARDPWIVAVNMVSEGVDIPRLRVGVYATAAKTPLVFRQIVGRFVRVTTAGRSQSIDASWLYIPADPILRDHAATIESELRSALRKRDGLGEEEFEEERVDRLETERTEGLLFEPLSADVAPQMTLFGAPAAAVAVPVTLGTYEPPALAEEEPEEPPPPAAIPVYERRAQLRAERHRLVSQLRRRDGTSHREINAWLNNRIGIRSVDSATVKQLEKSVDLLVKKLSTSTRR